MNFGLFFDLSVVLLLFLVWVVWCLVLVFVFTLLLFVCVITAAAGLLAVGRMLDVFGWLFWFGLDGEWFVFCGCNSVVNFLFLFIWWFLFSLCGGYVCCCYCCFSTGCFGVYFDFYWCFCWLLSAFFLMLFVILDCLLVWVVVIGLDLIGLGYLV